MLSVRPPFLSLHSVKITSYTASISHLLEVPVPLRLEGTTRVQREGGPQHLQTEAQLL